MWTQHQLIKFLVAHVFFLGPDRYNAQLFSKRLSLLVTVSSSSGRDCWQRKRQDLCDDLKRLFFNVPCDNVHPFPSSADVRSLHTCCPAFVKLRLFDRRLSVSNPKEFKLT